MRTKRFFGVLLGAVFCSVMFIGLSGQAFAAVTVYEDAEDGDTLGWSVFDNDPFGGTITNVYDTDRISRVIELLGSGTANGYELRNEDGSNWQNSTQFVLEWSMKCSEEVRVFVDVETDAGLRFLYYSTVDTDNGISGGGEYVHHGLGSDIMDGEWYTFMRDLEADLQEFQPGVSIWEVNGLYIRGSGRFDDIKLHDEMLPLLSIGDVTIQEDAGSAVFTTTVSETSSSDITVLYVTSDGTAMAPDDYTASSGTATILPGNTTVDVNVTILDDTEEEGKESFFMSLSNPINAALLDDTGVANILANDFSSEYMVYEDAQDGDTLGWSVFDNDPFGGTITNVYDADRGSRVIELLGAGTENGYVLRNEDGSNWQNSSQLILEWSMKCSEEVRVFVELETDDGPRYVYYTPVDTDYLANAAGTYVHHGLGSDIIDGEWYTFVRDLEADLQEAQPDRTILQVNGLFIRGSGRLDDIRLWLSGIIFLTINDVSRNEDAGTAQFTITASGPSGSAITVDYATSDGTALAGSDYVTSSGTATILPDNTMVDVNVTILEDTEEEGEETFSLTLSNPVNASLMDDTGVATISYSDICLMGVPKTGQTTSYAAGDDGAWDKGIASPGERFTDYGDGTITDNLTGLVWLKNADCFGQKAWTDALNECNTLGDGDCGLTDGSSPGDWRLPNIRERHSLVDYGQPSPGPALPDGHPFANVQSSISANYWSSTTNAAFNQNAWHVHSPSGCIHHVSKITQSYVWCVRGGN